MGGGYDMGHANFYDSAAARSAVNAANPLSPGGLSPKGTHLPTLAWAGIFIVVAFLLYHAVIKR